MALQRSLGIALPATILAGSLMLAATGTGCGAEETPLLLTSASAATGSGTGGAGGDANHGGELFNELEPVLVK